MRGALAELHELVRATPALLIISLFSWALLAGLDERFTIAGVCASGTRQLEMAARWAFLSTYTLGSPGRIILSGFAMILAMMAPLLRAPVSHIWHRSLAQRRTRAMLLFSLAYAMPWFLALFCLVTLAVILRVTLSSHSEFLLAAAGLLALLWQITPWKRRCLARCHVTRPLRAFGTAAEVDSLRSGLVASVWCIGTCWAFMLVPLAANRAHVLWMAAMSVAGLIDRSHRPR
ncbi:MAG TPA: DUF2182 domain-containing protein [Steroidobacteraceae bacterium]|nr:DUF2182 domain-containing protein [Steroidobacteraceae bacterium]